jgi:hypothetical protein
LDDDSGSAQPNKLSPFHQVFILQTLQITRNRCDCQRSISTFAGYCAVELLWILVNVDLIPPISLARQLVPESLFSSHNRAYPPGNTSTNVASRK